MLTKFAVQGFKNFNEECCIDFTDSRNYEFNQNAIKDGIIKTSLIFGPNSSGKSNLGYAIFDIISTLTDKNSTAIKYDPYLSLEGNIQTAKFKYEFQFANHVLKYGYAKTGHIALVEENLSIDDKTIIAYENGNTFVDIPGAEHLNTDLYDSSISLVKYVYKNTRLDKRYAVVNCFYSFMSYVEHMLLFKSLKVNEYIGFTIGTTDTIEYIIKNDKVSGFQAFLHQFGIEYQLEADSITKKILYCRFGNKLANFLNICSTGTISLLLFFYWYTQIQAASFVFIDEFDAFYHSDVARKIVEILRDKENLQVVLTTHNTDIMTNSLLRPDCYFLIVGKQIKSIVNCTDKELRVAHNLQKMYKAGAFSK